MPLALANHSELASQFSSFTRQLLGQHAEEVKEPEKRRGEASLAFEGFVVLAECRRAMTSRQGLARQLGDEFLNRGLGVEANLDGVGPHESAAENAPGQA